MTQSFHEVSQSTDPNKLSYAAIGAAMKVHTALGPGLLESAYEQCLEAELVLQGFNVSRQVPMPINYEHLELDQGYRMDIVINNTLVLELKAKDALHDVDYAQLLTYLRLGNFGLGLLINFHVTSLKQGIKRVINSYDI